MSNSGVNTAFAKCFIAFMAMVILLQGCVYWGLSMWGITITLRNCPDEALDLAGKPFQFAMNLIYFLNENCGNPSVKLPGITGSTYLDVDFNKADIIERRTFIFLISYAVISTLWIITSLAVIIILCRPITRTVYCLCFYPWFLIVMAGSILDAAATGFHIYDILNTTTVVKTFNYLGISAKDETIQLLSTFDAYFITPAAIMTCISSRVILIWLLNIFGSSFCLSLSRTLSKRNTLIRTNSTTNISSIQQASHQDISPVQETHPGDPRRVTERTKPALPLLTIQNVHPQSVTSIQLDNNSRLFNVQSPTIPPSNFKPAPLPVIEQNQNIDHQNNRVNYQPPQNISQYQQQLSPISPLNNRYSSNNENFQYPKQNQRVSEELKGQMPWSYTNFPTSVPKKLQIQVYPEIPPPDYAHNQSGF